VRTCRDKEGFLIGVMGKGEGGVERWGLILAYKKEMKNYRWGSGRKALNQIKKLGEGSLLYEEKREMQLEKKPPAAP